MSEENAPKVTQLEYQDFWLNKESAVGPEHIQRRRIASSMNKIMGKLIRMDASVKELESYANQMEDLERQIIKHGRLDRMAIMNTIANDEATTVDALNIVDFSLFIGASTPFTLPMDVWLEGEKVCASANLGIQYEGPPGRVHGGIVCALLDTLLTRAQSITKQMGFTGTLTIKFLAPTPIEADIRMEAEVARVEGRKLFITGKILYDGAVTAEAEGVWIQPKVPIF
ncbi:MAG: hypothetical protein JKY67_03695 [Pseudomonadales bacterium]|nr:hypothetical protein [Pseudomonadales bacterium]